MSALAKTKVLQLNPGERDCGVIVSVRNLDTEAEEILHEPGRKRKGDIFECLRRACERIEAAPGRWVIETVSTPTSVYRDLQGMRISANGAGEDSSVAEFTSTPYATELTMLSRVGYLHLLTPNCVRGRSKRT